MKYLHILTVLLNLRAADTVTECSPRYQCQSLPLSSPTTRDLLAVSIQLQPKMDSKQNPSINSDASRYNCGTCDRTVSWDQKGVACESCGLWYHASCQSIGGYSYDVLGASDITWHCVVCGNPNYSNIAFDLHSLCYETSSEPSLSTTTDTTIPPMSPDGRFKPIHASIRQGLAFKISLTPDQSDY